MITNLLNTILFIIITINTLSQSIQKFVYDPVDQTTIPFAQLLCTNKQLNLIGDKNGTITIDTNILKSNDLIQISAIGYQTKEIPYFIIKDSNKIFLNQRHVTLKEVSIKTRRYKNGKLGNKKKTGKLKSPKKIIRFHSFNHEHFFFIPNSENKIGILKSVNLFVHKGSSIPFSFNLYEYTPLSNSPGKKLNDSPIYFKEFNNFSWTKIPVSKSHISIPKGGLYIGVPCNIDTIVFYDKKNIKTDDTSATLIANEPLLYENSLDEPNHSFLGLRKLNHVTLIKSLNDTISNHLTSLAAFIEILYEPEEEDKKYYSYSNSKELRDELKKINPENSKENTLTYPHSTINDLFISVDKAIKENRFTYIKNFLLCYKKPSMSWVNYDYDTIISTLKNIDIDDIKINNEFRHGYSINIGSNEYKIIHLNNFWYLNFENEN